MSWLLVMRGRTWKVSNLVKMGENDKIMKICRNNEKTQRNNEVMTKYRDKGEWEGLTQLHFVKKIEQWGFFFSFFSLFLPVVKENAILPVLAPLPHPYGRPLITSWLGSPFHASWPQPAQKSITEWRFLMIFFKKKVMRSKSHFFIIWGCSYPHIFRRLRFAQWATGPIALPCKNSRFCNSRIWQQVLYCFSCKNARFNRRTSLFTLSNSSSSSSISFLPEENRWRQDLPDQVSNCNNSILCAFMQMIYIFSESSFHPLSSDVKIILMRVDGKTRIFCTITH